MIPCKKWFISLHEAYLQNIIGNLNNFIFTCACIEAHKSSIGEIKYLQYKEKDFYLFDEVTTDLVLRFSAEN